ncbi:MAG TPA: hypothetical protein VEG35_01750, partial [Burkholderiales bacterium]|nr:hypothetical protein [Burkholderiales bacterium]
MAVFRAIGNGMGTAARRPKVLLILWTVNIVYALLIATPLYALVKSDLGHSLLGRSLHLLDFLWLGELVYKFQGMGPALTAGFLVSLVLYLGLYIFLNGGIIGRLVDREGRPTLQAFFADCGRYFGRFVRLFLVSLVFYVLAFGVVLALLARSLKPVLDQARTEWALLWVSWLRTLAALLLLSLVHMVFDYARIAVVADNERRVLRALERALKFIGRRFFRNWSLYLLIGAG